MRFCLNLPLDKSGDYGIILVRNMCVDGVKRVEYIGVTGMVTMKSERVFTIWERIYGKMW